MATSSRPQDNQKRDNGSTRKRLLDAATRAFSEYGFQGASLRSIADDAGVGFGLIRYHFGSKAALWTATISHLYENLIVLRNTFDFDPSRDFRSQVKEHLREIVLTLFHNHHLRKICIQESLANSERYEALLDTNIKVFMESAHNYFEGLRSLNIASELSASEMHYLIHVMIAANQSGPKEVGLILNADDEEELIDKEVDLLWRLIVSPDPDREALPDASD